MQEEYLKKRTLYLIERGNGTTVRRDGPSVLIDRKFKSPVRIPADYIDKVVIYGNVEIDAFSITLFTSKLVPILIIGRRDESSIILPDTKEIKTYQKYQNMMLESKRLVETFKNWVYEEKTKKQQRTLNSLFKNISIRNEPGGNTYQELICKIMPSDFLWSMIKGIMRNLLTITIISRLIKFKLDPHVGVINQGCNYGLVYDIYSIHEPTADYLTFQFFYADGVNTDFIKEPDLDYNELRFLVDKFEDNRLEIEHELNASISYYFSLIRSVMP